MFESRITSMGGRCYHTRYRIRTPTRILHHLPLARTASAPLRRKSCANPVRNNAKGYAGRNKPDDSGKQSPTPSMKGKTGTAFPPRNPDKRKFNRQHEGKIKCATQDRRFH